MNRTVKSVALVLAIALVAAPAAALSLCWMSSDEAQRGCASGCPMMAMMDAHPIAGTLQQVASGTSCCDISSGQPDPTTQLQVPADSSRTAATPLPSSGAFAAVIVPASSDSPGSMPPLPTASPQAVLCTFLI